MLPAHLVIRIAWVFKRYNPGFTPTASESDFLRVTCEAIFSKAPYDWPYVGATVLKHLFSLNHLSLMTHLHTLLVLTCWIGLQIVP